VVAGEETRLDLPITPTGAAEAVEVDDSTGASAVSSFYGQTGAWAAASNPELGYLGTYRAAAPDGGANPATATWTPFVPVAGTYRVYARWAEGTNRTNAAVYRAETAGETVTFPSVDQRTGGGAWNLLGSAYFHLGRAGRITVSANAGGYVIADAVRLERETPEFWPITTYTVPKAVLSAPVSDGENVYFGSGDGHLYAYNMAEDRPLWRYPTTEAGLGAAVGRPAVNDGIIFFGLSNGQVRAVRTLAPSGSYLEQPQLLWTSTAVVGGVLGSPSVLNGVLYVGGGDGRVYGLNGSLGVINGVGPGGLLYRSPALGARVISTPAVLSDAGVWVEIEDGRVARLSLDLATVRWQSDGGAGTDASVYTDGRTVFASSTNGTVLAYNAANGQTVWSATLAPGGSAATPMGDGDGGLYVVTSDNRLWSLDAATGAARPGYESGRALPQQAGPGAPLVARNAGEAPDVYVPATSRLTAAGATRTRQHDLSRALGSHGPGRFHAPALCGDYVVATNDNGQLIGWKR
jgi:outer membrane protein assembly factor BamB